MARDRGVRLPTPRRGVSGRLVMEADVDHGFLAKLLPAGEREPKLEMLPRLHGAQVRRITSNGLVIRGFEVIPRRSNNKSGADRYTQTWWCLVHTVPLADYLDMGKLEEIVGPVMMGARGLQP